MSRSPMKTKTIVNSRQQTMSVMTVSAMIKQNVTMSVMPS